ncbi:MAG: hypothetical protein ACJAWC_003097 [Yoonia sp.]|jgi:hypothetical protein
MRLDTVHTFVTHLVPPIVLKKGASGPRELNSQHILCLNAQLQLELHAHLLHKEKPSFFVIADPQNKL